MRKNTGNMKAHPTIPQLRISRDGETFTYFGKKLKVRTSKGKNHPLQVVTIDRTVRSAAKLILETYKPLRVNGKRKYARYKDGNKRNVHPDNLYWSTNNQENRSYKKYSESRAKLTPKQTELVWHLRKQNNPLSLIANAFNVSDMTIHRAIKRYEKKLKENN